MEISNDDENHMRNMSWLIDGNRLSEHNRTGARLKAKAKQPNANQAHHPTSQRGTSDRQAET